MLVNTKRRKIYTDGQVLLSTNLAMTAIHRGAKFEDLNLINAEEIEKFNFFCSENDNDIQIIPTEINHATRQQQWNYPAEYDQLDVVEYFINKCNTDIERDRVMLELSLFQNHNLMKLLRWAIWFMDHVRANNEFIGVGRGSSVASYCLYLIELHMINSIECDLDPREFLK